jgi:hypothetical protein
VLGYDRRFEIDLQRLCIAFKTAIDGFLSLDAFCFNSRNLEVQLVADMGDLRPAVF